MGNDATIRKSGALPLGAAFAHARASGDDQSRAAQRRRANAFLRREGHPTMSRKVAKGILDRWRAMTPDERMDEFNLRAMKIPPDVARALAMQGNARPPKRQGLFGKSVAKASSYATAYKEAAKAQLDPDVHAAIHRHARSSAGGTASGMAKRARASSESAALLKRAARLRKRSEALMARVSKMGPTLSEVHSPAPNSGGLVAGPPRRRREDEEERLGRIGKSERVTKKAGAEIAKGGPGSGPQPGGGAGTHLAIAGMHAEAAVQARQRGDNAAADAHQGQALARIQQAYAARAAASRGAVQKRHMVAQLADRYVQAAFGAPQLPPASGSGMDPPEMAPFLDAQRLVAGMDQELSGGAESPSMARARASAALATNMGHYDRVIAGPDRSIAGVGGLNLDLGSGQARERGYLGIDTYPFDYGTVIHDLGQGIPFPDGSARAVRLNNALEDLEDYADNPTPLLLEVQRVLGLGGKFYYVGPPLQDAVDWSVLPGMGVSSSQFGNGGRTLALTLQRIPAKLPLVYGADTNFLSVDERCPADLALAQATFGAVPPADVAMANLVHKKEHVAVQARVLKKDDWEHIVLGAVLVPDEQDSQGDLISAEEIRATAHNFLAKARVVGKEHTETWDGGEVVESYLAPVDMEFADPMYGPQKISAGTWVLGVRVPEADWPSILDGSFTGFSVGGWGEREDLNGDSNG